MTLNDIILVANGILTAIIAVMTYLNRKAIQDVHISLNSRLSALLEANKAASMAEGREIGRAENKV